MWDFENCTSHVRHLARIWPTPLLGMQNNYVSRVDLGAHADQPPWFEVEDSVLRGSGFQGLHGLQGDRHVWFEGSVFRVYAEGL